MISHRQLKNTLPKMSRVLFKKIVAVVDLSFVFDNVTMSVVSEKNPSDKKIKINFFYFYRRCHKKS